MEKRDRKETLYEAAEQLNLAIDNIRCALRGTSMEGHANAYIIGHLRSWLDGDGTYNMGIHQYIDKLEEEEDEFED